MTKDSEVHLKNCLLIHTCSLSTLYWSMVSLFDRVFAFRTEGQWIKYPWTLFFRSNKTSECSEIYCEQLTSEHFPLYNYRSSTLRGISWNIGRLFRQCVLSGRNWFYYTMKAATVALYTLSNWTENNIYYQNSDFILVLVLKAYRQRMLKYKSVTTFTR